MRADVVHADARWTPRPSRTRLRDLLLLYPRVGGWGARVLIAAWLIVDRSLGVSRISETEIRSLEALDSYAQFQIASTAVLAFYLLASLTTRQVHASAKVLFSRPLCWIVMYIALAVGSAMWSDAPALTAFKALQCAVFLPVALISMGALGTLQRRVRFLSVLGLLYLAAAYATYFAVTVPEFGFTIFTLHFVVGTVPFLGVLFLLRMAESPALSKMFAGAYLLVLVAETVLTVYVGLIATMLFRSYLRVRHLSRYLNVMIPLIGLVIIVMVIPDDPDASLLGIKKVGEIAEGTGRFEVWRYAIEVGFPDAPVLGHGFVVGDAIGRAAGINVALGQLHNSYLSALLNLGLVGFCLWLLFIGDSYLHIARAPRHDLRIGLACAAFVYAFQQMFGGASLSSMMHSVWISHALFFSLVALQCKRGAQVVHRNRAHAA